MMIFIIFMIIFIIICIILSQQKEPFSASKRCLLISECLNMKEPCIMKKVQFIIYSLLYICLWQCLIQLNFEGDCNTVFILRIGHNSKCQLINHTTVTMGFRVHCKQRSCTFTSVEYHRHQKKKRAHKKPSQNRTKTKY